jgi:hypothetical protein
MDDEPDVRDIDPGAEYGRRNNYAPACKPLSYDLLFLLADPSTAIVDRAAKLAGNPLGTADLLAVDDNPSIGPGNLQAREPARRSSRYSRGKLDAGLVF